MNAKNVHWMWPSGHHWQPHRSGVKEKKMEKTGISPCFKELDWEEGKRWDNDLGLADVLRWGDSA